MRMTVSRQNSRTELPPGAMGIVSIQFGSETGKLVVLVTFAKSFGGYLESG